MRRLILIVIASLASAGAFAQDRPIVRAEVTPMTVAVGEAAELKITVLVPTWFTRPPTYPTFELANAITRIPDDSSYSLRERVGNESWSGIVRSYEVLPLLGANYRLSGQTMSITYANPGSDAVTVDVDVPEVLLRGSVPTGAAELDPYIAGRNLTLSLNVEGDASDLTAGDALVISYVAELDGLPAIFLPPLAPELSFEGVSVYADTAEVADGAIARRSEKLTLVFDTGGEFVIPGHTLGFWNTATESIESAIAEGFTISVAGPLTLSQSDAEAVEQRWFFWVSIGGGLILLASVLRVLGPAAAASIRSARERREQSEPYAFAKLQAALRSNDAKDAYRAMLGWLERLDRTIGLRQFASSYGDDSLLSAVDALSQMNYAGGPSGGDLGELADALSAARSRYLRQSKMAVETALPPLNP
jgi:hypothetical protein